MGLLKNRYELGRIEILFIVLVFIAVLGVGAYAWKTDRNKKTEIDSFAACVAAGNPVMESYPEQCAVDGKSFTNPDQQVSADPEEEGTADSPNALSEQAVKMPYSELPAELRAVILAQVKEKAPECATNEQIVDLEGKPVNPSVTYASLSSAITPIGCEGGFAALFAMDKQANWVFVEGTQDLFTCASISGYPIPKSLLEVGMNGATTCFNEATQAEREYDSLYL